MQWTALSVRNLCPLNDTRFTMTIQDLVRKLQATNCWAITFIVYSVATLVANYFIQYSHTDLYNNF